MHLSPRDVDKLLVHQAGVLAQKRLARGLRLSYPEAVALIATQLLERIRDGKSVAELMDLGRRIINKTDLAPHVGADLGVMERDARKMRGDGPTVFAQATKGVGLDAILEHIRSAWRAATG